MPPHDLEQARVIGEAELLRGARDVPLVALEGADDDPALRLGLQLDERVRVAGRGARDAGRGGTVPAGGFGDKTM